MESEHVLLYIVCAVIGILVLCCLLKCVLEKLVCLIVCCPCNTIRWCCSPNTAGDQGDEKQPFV